MAAKKKGEAGAKATPAWETLATIKAEDLLRLLTKATKVASDKVRNCGDVKLSTSKDNRTIAVVATDMIRALRAETMAASVEMSKTVLFHPKQATVFLGAIGNKAQLVTLKLRDDSARMTLACGPRKLEIALADTDAMPLTKFPSPDDGEWCEITPYGLFDLLEGTEWGTSRLDTPVIAIFPDDAAGMLRAEGFDNSALAAVMRPFVHKGAPMPPHLLLPVVAKSAIDMVSDYAASHEQSVLLRVTDRWFHVSSVDGSLVVGTVTADGSPSDVSSLVAMEYPWSVRLPREDLAEAIKAAKAATSSDGAASTLVLQVTMRGDGKACLSLRAEGSDKASQVTDEVPVLAVNGEPITEPWAMPGDKLLASIEVACKIAGGKDPAKEILLCGLNTLDPFRILAAREDGTPDPSGLWMLSPLRTQDA